MYAATVIVKIRHTCYATWRRNLSQNSLFCQIPSVTSKELALPRFARFELSRLLLSSYLGGIKRKISSCSACGQPRQDLPPFLLDCPASELLRRANFGTTSSIFDLWSRQLGFRRIPPCYLPPEGLGSTTTTIFIILEMNK